MAKLRKMLGSADAPGVVALMRQMETQSRETLARWSAGYARESLLPICLAAHPQDTLPARLLALAMDWAEGRCDGKMVRPLLAALRDAARQETAPAVQAALRAIGTAAAVMQTPTNALGMTFYAAAALAYQTLGKARTQRPMTPARRDCLPACWQACSRYPSPKRNIQRGWTGIAEPYFGGRWIMKYTDINAQAVDQWVADGWEWGTPIDHETYVRAQQGDWQVLLTPTKPVPRSWFGELRGARVLGLASGGGQQMPVFAAAGAACTLLDYSKAQLASDAMVAQREGYAIELVRADMTQTFPFEDETFDLIFHPVSNCYVEDVFHVWRECFRVLKPGGILLAGLDNGLGYAFNEEGTALVQKLPYNPLKDEELYRQAMAAGDGIQFSHGIEEQIGGQLRAGFRLEDVYEDTEGKGNLHQFGVATFWATRSVKP